MTFEEKLQELTQRQEESMKIVERFKLVVPEELYNKIYKSSCKMFAKMYKKGIKQLIKEEKKKEKI